MSQPPGLCDGRIALRHCLIRNPKPEQDKRQMRLGNHVQVGSSLIREGAVGDWIIKEDYLFQVRSSGRKLAANELVATGSQVSQNEPGGIAALLAQTQQVLGQQLCSVEFSSRREVARLPIRNLQEFGWGTQLLPQFLGTGKDLAGFRRAIAINGL